MKPHTPPQKMSYQAVIRNTSGALVSSTSVGMQISILQGSVAGTAVYAETQTPITNAKKRSPLLYESLEEDIKVGYQVLFGLPGFSINNEASAQ